MLKSIEPLPASPLFALPDERKAQLAADVHHGFGNAERMMLEACVLADPEAAIRQP